EQLAEARQTRTGFDAEPPANLGHGMWEVGLTHHHEDALAGRSLELGDERHRVSDSIKDVAADDEVRRRDLGILPRACDDSDVVALCDVRLHAFGCVDLGDTLEPLS